MTNELQEVELKPAGQRQFTKNRSLWLGLIFLLSLAFRYEDFYLFREFNADKAHQLQAAYELLQGKGVSLESYDLTDFQPHTRPLLAWPPGYSYAVAGISKLTGLSVYNSSWGLDVLALAALWCILLWFAVLLRFTLVQSAILFLLFGFCRTPWVYFWSADTLGTVLFLFSAVLNVNLMQRRNGKNNLVLFALMQFAVICAMCFLKYSLAPAYFSLAIAAFSFSWKAKQKHYRTGFILLCSILLSFGLLAAYNVTLKANAAELGNLYQQERGLFFGNLLMFNAFFLKSLFYIEGFLQKAGSHKLEVFIQVLNLALVFLVLFHIGRRMIKGKADYFSHLVFWTTLSVCGFLSLLSVAYAQETFIGTYRWTYVKELRYFAPAVFLLVIYLIQNFQLRLPRTAFSALAFALIGFAVLYGFGLNGYYMLTKNRAGSFENMDGRIVRANQFMHERQDSNTYFLSMTGNSETDAQATSLAAISGSKVVITYDGTFPDAYFSTLFSKSKRLPPEKKIIVYLNKNEKVLDSLNPSLRHRVEQNKNGEEFLLVNP